MKICEGLHCLKIDFQVTPDVKRYVYVYMIVGKYCYLIDAGVHGSQVQIEAYLESIGYHLCDVKCIFLTHAHPDHMGSAAAIQKKTNCRIYGSMKEQGWMEDIELQFAQRPIPNFHILLQQPISLTHPIAEAATMLLEEQITLSILPTPGHSKGSLSFLLNGHILFCGDAIPVRGDIPIYIDVEEQLSTLRKLKVQKDITLYCPAWDHIYHQKEGQEKIDSALHLLAEFSQSIEYLYSKVPGLDDEQIFELVCADMQIQQYRQNPLFKQTIFAHIHQVKQTKKE